MPVRAEPTPNPNAMKFTVGVPVGGPGTYSEGAEADDAFVNDLLGIDGVASIFLAADFVTISKSAQGDWAAISDQAVSILQGQFPD